MKEISEIIFENDTIIAINKPAGILSVPDRYDPDRFSIANWILSLHPDARPLHRLDFETSGILLFSKMQEAFGWYSDQFESRRVKKYYHAVTEGRIRSDEGIIEEALYTQSNGKVIISKRGKESATKWKILERFLHHSYVEVNPLTGRTHQIRVHMSSIGHPLLSDVLYGASGPLFLSSLKGKRKYNLSKDEEAERPLFGRIGLHASQLVINDFHSKEPLSIEAPLPKDMAVAIQKLRQFSAIP